MVKSIWKSSHAVLQDHFLIPLGTSVTHQTGLSEASQTQVCNGIEASTTTSKYQMGFSEVSQLDLTYAAFIMKSTKLGLLISFWTSCKYGTVLNLILNQISPILYQVSFRNACL